MPKSLRKRSLKKETYSNQNKTFMQIESNRKEAINNMLDKDKEFECFICRENFYKLSILAAHIRISHEIEIDYNFCQYCNEEFSSYEEKNLHKCKVSRETPYPLVNCKKCEKCYHIFEENDHECFKTEEDIFNNSSDVSEVYSIQAPKLRRRMPTRAASGITAPPPPPPPTTTTTSTTRRNTRFRNDPFENLIYVEDFEGLGCDRCGKMLRSHASLALHRKASCKNQNL